VYHSRPLLRLELTLRESKLLASTFVAKFWLTHGWSDRCMESGYWTPEKDINREGSLDTMIWEIRFFDERRE